MKRLSLAFALLTGLAARAATTWYIAPEGRDDGTYDGKSWAQPFATLSNAVTKLANNDTIIVSNGVYKFEKSVTIPRENITLRSLTRDPKDVIFDGQDKTRLVFANVNATKVLGITFQHARYEGSGGADGLALYLRGGSTVLSNCVFRKNYVAAGSTGRGAALYVQAYNEASPAKIYDVLFEDNALSVTNSSATQRSLGAAVYAAAYAILTNCTICGNVLTNSTAGSYYDCSAGGGLWAEYSTILDCNIYSNENVNTGSSTAGYGGGAFLADSTMRNCRVWGNGAENSGGGIAARASSVIEYCMISNNVVRTKYYSGCDVCGAGVMMASAGKLRYCHIVTNRFLGSVSYCGGGSGVSAKAGSLVHDCLIECNRGQKGALGCNGSMDSGSGPAVFSNCVIRCNYSSSGGVLMTEFNGEPTLVTDCWAVSNSGPSLVVTSVQWGNRATHTFRNTYFCGNKVTSAWSPMLYSNCEYSYVSTQRYENCTFAYNRQQNKNDGPFVRDLADGNWGKAGSMIFLDRCAIWGCGTWMCDTETKYPWWQSENAHNSLLISVPASMKGLGNMAATGTAAVDPKFADAANGDFRLQADSPLVDAGGEVSAWMGTGRRRGQQDMGDGSYTILKAGKYGVAIRRNSPQARLRGAAPDIGCFEYRPLKGAAVFVR